MIDCNLRYSMARAGYVGKQVCLTQVSEACWLQANGMWGQLTALKKVVTEPKGTGEAFDGVMKEYYGAIRKGQGGLFMAVCRGKVNLASHRQLHKSEGPSRIYSACAEAMLQACH